MRVTVTGAAGFIGSNLCDALLAEGHDVLGLDNFSTGRRRFVSEAAQSSFELVELDLLSAADLAATVGGSDAIVHLAANADVRFGWDAPRRDLEQNVIVTHNVLEAARRAGVGRFIFSSTGSVYGEAQMIPTPEDCPFPVQTSLYGASKMAAEAYVEAYAEGAGLSTTVFRFVSNLGPRYTHGHVIDFVRQLRADPTRLTILGDGTQRKSYLDVSDCVAAIISLLDQDHGHEVYNLGVDDYCMVADSVGWICERMGCRPELEYTGGDRGWVGDNPFIYLDTTKILSTGWKPRFGIREAVEHTVDYLMANPWLFVDEGRPRMTPAAAAVIGCGLIGLRRAEALERCGVPVVAVHDTDADAANRTADLLGGRPVIAPTVEAAIGVDGVELVVVATPHVALAPISSLAAAAGRHVLVEKPGADSLEAVEQLAKAAVEHGVVVRVGYNHRFHPSFRRVRELLADGRYGPLLHIRARYGHGGRLGYEREWRARREVSGGGELIDQGSHLIDLTRHVAGDVELAFSELRTEYWEMDVDDNAFLALRTAAGGFAWLHASWSEWKNLFSFEITLREAKLEVTGLGGSYGPERLTLYEMGPALGPPDIAAWEWPPGDDSWALEIADVLADIDGGPSEGARIEDAVATFRIIDEAYPMIITRTPLRISLGGGGTDLPSFYGAHGGGFLIAAAISKYVYIAVHRNFDDDLIIKYSLVERVPSPASIKHPILRETLTMMGIEGGIEVTSMADIPAGTGLGSSGAFTVGVLKALHSHLRRPVTNEELAALACHIEIDRLGVRVGKQDQYASAMGGLTAFHFHPDDTVSVEPVAMPAEAKLMLEENLLLFFTGVRRSASDEIAAQVDERSPDVVDDNLKAVRDLGHESLRTLKAGDLDGFAALINEQWRLKLERAPTAFHGQIDDWLRQGLAAGAGGGKLIGAGGGGFLLFYADLKTGLRQRMAELGLEEVRFTFDHEGSMTLVV